MEARQRIRFCTAADGVRIAYAECGEGRPLVRVSWLTHLHHDWRSPLWRHWQAELSRTRRYVSYDARGCGLSDREVDDISLDAWVADLAAVIDDLGVETVDLLGICRGGAVTVAYAARYPERVGRMVIAGGYARGRFQRDPSAEDREWVETLLRSVRHGWGQSNPAFRRIFASLMVPGASREQEQWFDDLQRLSTSPRTAARMQDIAYMLDVRELASKVRVPTLLLHARGDAAVPLEEGRLLAGLIPESELVLLDSENHLLLEEEPAWRHFVDEVTAFLGGAASSTPFPDLTAREHEVLELIALGKSNEDIARTLCIAPKTVRNHVAHIYEKLKTGNRAQAVVLAREAGYGRREASDR